MTNDQREFHKRMNEAISLSLEYLRSDFDISMRDVDPAERPEWDIIRSTLKSLLLKAYARNHPWINEAA